MPNEKNFSENGLTKLKKEIPLDSVGDNIRKGFCYQLNQKRFERKVAVFKSQELDTNLKRKSSSEYTEKKRYIKITDTFTKFTSKGDLYMKSPVAKKKKTSK